MNEAIDTEDFNYSQRLLDEAEDRALADRILAEAENANTKRKAKEAEKKLELKLDRNPTSSILAMRDEDVEAMPMSRVDTKASSKVKAKNTPKSKPSTKPINSSNTDDYTIAKGDTLSAIAKRQGTTVAELKRINNISDPDKIQAGAKLKFKDTPKPDPVNPVKEALNKSEPLRLSKLDIDKIEDTRQGKYNMSSWDGRRGTSSKAATLQKLEKALVLPVAGATAGVVAPGVFGSLALKGRPPMFRPSEAAKDSIGKTLARDFAPPPAKDSVIRPNPARDIRVKSKK